MDDIWTITKTAVGQHALDGACEMLVLMEGGEVQARDMISAHILACSAAEVLGVLSSKHTGFSFYETFQKVGGQNGINKKAMNLAYNFFKHANKDSDKQLSFDPKYTLDVIYLAFEDLNRLQKVQPDAPDYEIQPAEHTLHVVSMYIPGRVDELSLAHLGPMLRDDDAPARQKAEEHIAKWFRARLRRSE